MGEEKERELGEEDGQQMARLVTQAPARGSHLPATPPCDRALNHLMNINEQQRGV